MKIFITGSNGLLGQKLILRLLQDFSLEIFSSSRGKPRGINASLSLCKKKQSFHYLDIDITDRSQVIHTMLSIVPDIIIHCGAMTQVDVCEINPSKCFQVNTEAVKYLIEVAKKNNTFIIFLSTDFVFDGWSTTPKLDEKVSTNPLSIYGQSKVLSEQLLLKSNLRHSIIRTSLVYGFTENNLRNNIVPWIVEKIRNDETVSMINDQWRTPTLVEDLANGCYLIAKKRISGIFNISGNEILTPYDIARKTATIFDLNPQKIDCIRSKELVQNAIRPKKTALCIKKAQRILGYTPHLFEQGLTLLKKTVRKLYN